MSRPAPEEAVRIAVVGAGTIGASWTANFLAHGLEVRVYDPRSDAEAFVRRFVERAWPALERLKLGANADPDRVSFCAEPAEAVEGAALVQESGPENLRTKRELLARMEAGLAPWTIVASSTSGFMPSELQEGRAGPERYLVGHPFNPPHLIPLVEVVGGRVTEPSVVDWTYDFYRRVGKQPIRVRKEMPGHVTNRMQAALYREAIYLALEEVADIRDIDLAISAGPGLRWALWGPHMIHHLAGGEGGLRHLLEHIGPNIQNWWATLGDPKLTPEAVDRLVDQFQASDPPPLERLVLERDELLLVLQESIEATRARLGGDDGGGR
ncbi:MAG: 3-hydroxyacyl-CoA dehydrogenase NAD-binding domain-containing protein [Geminicoccaceae bacterium]|nr:3-hydroxyacyl-CoA dehydrogenase NAD-binding domain-containing protein [Geminicoccaceae bacterium]